MKRIIAYLTIIVSCSSSAITPQPANFFNGVDMHGSKIVNAKVQLDNVANACVAADAAGNTYGVTCGGGTTPAISSVFGRTGTVTAQNSDYSTFYYPLGSNPSGYLTPSALTPYLTSALAMATYQPKGSYASLADLVWSAISGKPTFATVATSGSYNDLNDKPTLATQYTDALARSAVSLTTLGTGAATYNSTTGVLNVPTPVIPTLMSQLSNDLDYVNSNIVNGYLTSATAASTYEPKITAGASSQYWRGDKTWQTLPTIPAQYTPTAGTGIAITGTYPNQTIASTITQADGSETKLTAGANISITGAGTVVSPYVVAATAQAVTLDLGSKVDWMGGSTIPDYLLPISGGTYNWEDYPDFKTHYTTYGNIAVASSTATTFTLVSLNSQGVVSRSATTASASVTGANSVTIAQANLPNINLTATTAGDHDHMIRTEFGTTSNLNSGAESNYAQVSAAGGGYNNWTPIQNNGNHTHTVPLGGSGTALDITNKGFSVVFCVKVKPTSTAGNVTINNMQRTTATSVVSNSATKTGTFTSNGGTLVISWNGTSYNAGLGHGKLKLLVDNVERAQSWIYFNTNVHLTYPTVTTVIADLAAGSHTIGIYDAGNAYIDGNDRFNITVLELP